MRRRWLICLGLIPFLMGGCVASKILNRSNQQQDNSLQTPSLRSVPARPEKTSSEARHDLLEEMEKSYEMDQEEIPNRMNSLKDKNPSP